MVVAIKPIWNKQANKTPKCMAVSPQFSASLTLKDGLSITEGRVTLHKPSRKDLINTSFDHPRLHTINQLDLSSTAVLLSFCVRLLTSDVSENSLLSFMVQRATAELIIAIIFKRLSDIKASEVIFEGERERLKEDDLL